MLKSYIYLLWCYFRTVSEFSCLAKLAKPYPVFGPSYLPQNPNLLHCRQNGAHQVAITIYWARLLAAFTLNHLLCL